jgi:hypothetical protein
MIDDDLELEARIRGALDRHQVPDRPLRRRRQPVALQRILLGFAMVALVLAGVGIGRIVVTFRSDVSSNAAASTPNPQLPAFPSKLRRADAIALVHELPIVGRVDRIDAKLMNFDEYVRIAGPVRIRPGDPQGAPVTGFGITGDPTQRYVWAVAVSGEIWPNGRQPVLLGGVPSSSSTPYPPYRWGLFLVDAGSGQFMIVGDAGVDAEWPPQFGALPSHPTP